MEKDLPMNAFIEEPGGKVVAPEGQVVLTLNVLELDTGTAHVLMQVVLEALNNHFELAVSNIEDPPLPAEDNGPKVIS